MRRVGVRCYFENVTVERSRTPSKEHGIKRELRRERVYYPKRSLFELYNYKYNHLYIFFLFQLFKYYLKKVT